MVKFEIGEIVDVTYYNGKKKLSVIEKRAYGERFWIQHLNDKRVSDVEPTALTKDRIATLLYG